MKKKIRFDIFKKVSNLKLIKMHVHSKIASTACRMEISGNDSYVLLCSLDSFVPE